MGKSGQEVNANRKAFIAALADRNHKYPKHESPQWVMHLKIYNSRLSDPGKQDPRGLSYNPVGLFLRMFYNDNIIFMKARHDKREQDENPMSPGLNAYTTDVSVFINPRNPGTAGKCLGFKQTDLSLDVLEGWFIETFYMHPSKDAGRLFRRFYIHCGKSHEQVSIMLRNHWLNGAIFSEEDLDDQIDFGKYKQTQQTSLELNNE